MPPPATPLCGQVARCRGTGVDTTPFASRWEEGRAPRRRSAISGTLRPGALPPRPAPALHGALDDVHERGAWQAPPATHALSIQRGGGVAATPTHTLAVSVPAQQCRPPGYCQWRRVSLTTSFFHSPSCLAFPFALLPPCSSTSLTVAPPTGQHGTPTSYPERRCRRPTPGSRWTCGSSRPAPLTRYATTGTYPCPGREPPREAACGVSGCAAREERRSPPRDA